MTEHTALTWAQRDKPTQEKGCLGPRHGHGDTLSTHRSALSAAANKANTQVSTLQGQADTQNVLSQPSGVGVESPSNVDRATSRSSTILRPPAVLDPGKAET